MWKQLNQIIKKYDNFLITTHINPDGDGVGSACAFTELLLQMGKKVRFVCDSPIPRKFAFLDYHGTHEIYHPDSDYKEIEVVIVLDTHNRARIGGVSQVIDKQNVVVVCIDHHPINESFTEHLIINPNACSVGAMIYAIYKDSGFLLNIRAATGIYTSVVCDTGRFCYSSTSRIAHAIAEECMDLGVDPDVMYSRLFQHVSLQETKLLISALQGMKTYFNDQVAIQEIKREDFSHLDIEDLEHIDLEYIHDFNSMIEDVRCFVLLREISSDKVRVSLRSKKDFDLSPVVKALGGGGHRNAAGLNWHGSLSEIKKKILKLLEDSCCSCEKN